ncbi:MAG: ABC transporter substrate-binding protein, partial [Candidatus Bathyarchaeota archaeon]|nr:ABC transporter substrate-binding protein [Candidatus Bathyarchaeota archaeon]
MGKVEKVSPLVLTLILVFSLSAISEAAKAASPTRGPRTEDLIINFYGNISSAYAALKAAEIDIVGYEIVEELYEDAIADSNIVLAPVADSMMYQFDINNNCTIATYPGIRSPTNYQGFRQALAWLTDKEYIIEEACEGFAERIDQPIAAPYKGWRNESMWYPNYPYEYNPVAAAATLDAEGFLQGTTPNPYYDAAFPGSAEYIRVYPAGHSKAGQDLD